MSNKELIERLTKQANLYETLCQPDPDDNEEEASFAQARLFDAHLMRQAAEALSSAEAEIAGLREALKPFACLKCYINADAANDAPAGYYFKVGDLRRARSALSSTEHNNA